MAHYIMTLILLSALAFGQENQKTLDKKFVILGGVNFASAIADSVTSVHAMHQVKFNNGGLAFPACAESNPLFGTHPSNARYYGQIFATAAAFQGLSYILKRKHNRYWAMPLLYDTASHVWGIQENVRKCY